MYCFIATVSISGACRTKAKRGGALVTRLTGNKYACNIVKFIFSLVQGQKYITKVVMQNCTAHHPQQISRDFAIKKLIYRKIVYFYCLSIIIYL